MRILLAEDNLILGKATRMGLQELGHTVDWVTDGIAAELALKDADNIDILVLDLGLPRQDGLEVLRKLRQTQSPLPVLVLTARDAVENRIEGLDLGADDYMIKPFDLHELAARLRALKRRQTGKTSPVLCYGNLELNPAGKTLKQDGKPVKLTLHEYLILEKLLNHTGQVITRAQLESLLYGWDEGAESNVLEVQIHHLRQKLGKTLIRTVRGVGYSIPEDINES